MKNVGGTSEYIAFLDECGDHTLELIDKDFPLFLLATAVMRRADPFYREQKLIELPFVAEARGKNEDETFERCFYRMMSEGTDFIKGTRFKRLRCPLVFRRKFDNIAGIQLADLCAHPCAKRVLRPKQSNRAFDIMNEKIYRNGGVVGWKVFP